MCILPNARQFLQARNELEDSKQSNRVLMDRCQKLAESLAANEEEHKKVRLCCNSLHQIMKCIHSMQELYIIRQQWQNDLKQKDAAYEETMKRQQQEMSEDVAEVCGL